MTNEIELAVGRCLLAMLFLAGAVQKTLDPSGAQSLLAGFSLSEWLVWPALLFNTVAGAFLVANLFVRPVSRALALYCVLTSVFHLIPSDPWQMTIFVKNWALAGGFLVLAACSPKQYRSAP